MRNASAVRKVAKLAPGKVGQGGQAPRRRPEAGGYARGDEVRSRILLAAIEMFGEQGFASASTRTIAARAGVNPPALQYYFHNKERLHQACAQYLADRIKGHLEAPMALARDVVRAADRSAVPGRCVGADGDGGRPLLQRDRSPRLEPVPGSRPPQT